LSDSARHSTKAKRVTKVLSGVDTVVNALVEFLDKTDDEVYVCVDQTRPALNITLMKEALLRAKKRGVRLKYITEITKDNLPYCKKLLPIVDELRHLDGIKGNLYISKSGYLAPASFHEKGKSASQIIYSNVKEVIDNQKYVFESFWGKGIPSEYRIRELEEGIVPVKTDLIRNPQKTLELFLNLIKSAQFEIMLIIPTINAFLREERIGAIKLLKRATIERKVMVRIIGPSNKIIENELLAQGHRPREKQDEGKYQQHQQHIQYSDVRFEHTAVTTVTILVIDRKESLAIEKTDDSKLDFVKAIGLSTYSNSEPTVMSYVSIFEGLSKQADLNEQLKTHSSMQKEFINIAAHELRTPAQSILGFSELAVTSNGLTAEMQDMLNPIYNNAVRLSKLIEDVLSITKIESRTLNLNRVKLNINENIANVLSDMKNQIPTPNMLHIEFLNTKKPLYVMADKLRLYQVIANLVGNAIKFTQEGNISIGTRIEDGGNIVVSVKDTGKGIESHIVPKLFTKFATLSNSGTGLGLYISKSIIEAHGGRMWAENNPKGKGATFSFSLPIVQTK
jgi:nitrogen-specific signal transduction histidine kinase/sugar-specific transcriptional regulator TrmB